jgi:hypothetical protein
MSYIVCYIIICANERKKCASVSRRNYQLFQLHDVDLIQAATLNRFTCLVLSSAWHAHTHDLMWNEQGTYGNLDSKSEVLEKVWGKRNQLLFASHSVYKIFRNCQELTTDCENCQLNILYLVPVWPSDVGRYT